MDSLRMMHTGFLSPSLALLPLVLDWPPGSWLVADEGPCCQHPSCVLGLAAGVCASLRAQLGLGSQLTSPWEGKTYTDIQSSKEEVIVLWSWYSAGLKA